MQPGTAMCFLNFYTLVFWIPLVPIHILIGPVLESVLVLAVQILGPFGPPKKCVNFDRIGTYLGPFQGQVPNLGPHYKH